RPRLTAAAPPAHAPGTVSVGPGGPRAVGPAGADRPRTLLCWTKEKQTGTADQRRTTMRGDNDPGQAEQQPPGAGTGNPDGWDRLWTPHRMADIKGEGRPTGPGADDDCPFCRAPGVSDPAGLLVARGEHAYAVLNLYPYNSGHLLVCP